MAFPDLSQAREPNDIPELYLPERNEFLPENLDVNKVEVAQSAKRPHLIRESSLSQLWYKKDDQFWVPRAQVCIDIRRCVYTSNTAFVNLTGISPHANVSPKAAV